MEVILRKLSAYHHARLINNRQFNKIGFHNTFRQEDEFFIKYLLARYNSSANIHYSGQR